MTMDMVVMVVQTKVNVIIHVLVTATKSAEVVGPIPSIKSEVSFALSCVGST